MEQCEEMYQKSESDSLGGRDIERLRRAGLRPTRQRIALARLLFARGDRHVTAEELHEKAVLARVPVSLDTIYNTLHQPHRGGIAERVG